MSCGRHVRFLAFLSYAFLCAAPLAAEPREFDFKDPKGVNTIAFVADSLLEPIMGLATDISGKVTYDSSNPTSFSGRIAVDVAAVRCSLPAMTKVLHSADWMDAKAHPVIEFVFKKVQTAKSPEGNVASLTVTGDFQCKGVTKQLTVPVTATYLPGQLAKRMQGKEGDLLVLRSTFSIRRSDFGIKPGSGIDSVGEEIELRVSIVGAASTKDAKP